MYIAIDGDSVGVRLQQFILDEKLNELRVFSETIKKTLDNLVVIIENNGGTVYMSGGDNIFAEGDEKCIMETLKALKKINMDSPINYSMAAGATTRDTYLALKYAKGSKKHYIKVIITDEKELSFQDI